VGRTATVDDHVARVRTPLSLTGQNQPVNLGAQIARKRTFILVLVCQESLAMSDQDTLTAVRRRH
jgi:hypothetical protein